MLNCPTQNPESMEHSANESVNEQEEKHYNTMMEIVKLFDGMNSSEIERIVSDLPRFYKRQMIMIIPKKTE